MSFPATFKPGSWADAGLSSSAAALLGFRLLRRPATERYAFGPERSEDLARGSGIAAVFWASAAFAGYESIRKLLMHGSTTSLKVSPGRSPATWR